MFELLLILYLFAVVGATYATLKHYGLLVKSPAAQLEEKNALMEQVMRILHGSPCPICGSKDTYVESVDLWRTNTAIVACNNQKCLQKSMWKLENHVWRLIAPYRYVPKPLTKLEPSPTEKITEKEEIKLEFG